MTPMDGAFKEEIGRRIAERRVELGMTQREVELELGYPMAGGVQMSRWERGRVLPKRETRVSLAAILGLELSDLGITTVTDPLTGDPTSPEERQSILSVLEEILDRLKRLEAGGESTPVAASSTKTG